MIKWESMDDWSELSFDTTKLVDKCGSASSNPDEYLLMLDFDNKDGSTSLIPDERLMQDGPNFNTTKLMDKEELLLTPSSSSMEADVGWRWKRLS